MFYKILILVLIALSAVISMAYVAYKKQSPILLTVNSFVGLILLTLLKLISPYIYVKIYINIVSVLLAVILGPVGVILFIVADCIFL